MSDSYIGFDEIIRIPLENSHDKQKNKWQLIYIKY